MSWIEYKDADDAKIKDEILSILNGNIKILIDKINEKIEINSRNMNYEVCKELATDLEYVNITFKSQNVELNDGVNRDIINYYYDNSYVSITIMFLRNGKLVGFNNKIIPVIGEISSTVLYYITSFYSKNNIAPKEVIVPSDIDKELLECAVSSKFISVMRGEKKKLFDMAYNNAKIYYDNEIKLIYKNEEFTENATNELRDILGLSKLHMIEAFDNSNLFGTFTVSAMVCFVDGVPYKKNYRKFKLSFEANDDVKAMKEVIYRRYYRVLYDNLERCDLIIVDGGINQINACLEVLNSLNLDIMVIGVRKDNHHSPDAIIRSDGSIIEISKSSNVFRLLSRIDEEAHRFVISYHREIRSKGSISSVLDNISGLGEVRKKALIKKYGSVSKIKNSTVDEIATVVPYAIAQNVYNYFKSMDLKE